MRRLWRSHRGMCTQGLQDGDLEKNLVDVPVQARVDAINSLLSKVRRWLLLRKALRDGLRSVSPPRAGGRCVHTAATGALSNGVG